MTVYAVFKTKEIKVNPPVDDDVFSSRSIFREPTRLPPFDGPTQTFFQNRTRFHNSATQPHVLIGLRVFYIARAFLQVAHFDISFTGDLLRVWRSSSGKPSRHWRHSLHSPIPTLVSAARIRGHHVRDKCKIRVCRRHRRSRSGIGHQSVDETRDHSRVCREGSCRGRRHKVPKGQVFSMRTPGCDAAVVFAGKFSGSIGR